MLTTRQKIALAGVVQHIVMAFRRLFGRGPISHVQRRHIHWELDLREGIDFSIWLLGAFEPETVRCYERILKPGNVVLDIGANIGAHTFLMARAVGPTGSVYAFEPTDYAFGKLMRNRSLNPDLADRVHCMQYMLVDSNMTKNPAPGLYSSWPLKPEEGLHELHKGRLMTTSGSQAKTLDSVVEALGLDRVDSIKLDIDGAECGMIRGATETLKRWRPTIVMELAPYALEEQGASLAELIGLLKECGYQLFNLSLDQALDMNPEALHLEIPRGASLNVVARASESRL